MSASPTAPDDSAEPDDDDRHLVIDGRRWRRTDPSIPEALRTQLVSVLMAGRRGVGAGKKAGDDEAVAAARRQVHDAKIALGERGDPWWDEPTPEGLDERIAATALTLLRGRDTDATICPSEAARTVGGNDWRDLMDRARSVAAALAVAGVVEVRQRGELVEPSVTGAIRIGRGAAFEQGRPRRG